MVRERRIPIMFSDDELREVDDWRYANRIPTRSRAIRELCKIALAGEECERALKEALEVDTGLAAHLGMVD